MPDPGSVIMRLGGQNAANIMLKNVTAGPGQRPSAGSSTNTGISREVFRWYSA